MDILIIGGTGFVGRHLVEAALDGGHGVTLFNRGQTNPGLYPGVEELHGDRDTDLEPLKGRSWDAVIDTCGYVPRVVRKSAELLKDAVGRYVFVSSMSVYSDINAMIEDGPVLGLDDPASEDVNAHYGGLKVACEQVVSEVYGERALNARPGFIVGRYDGIPRFPHLIQRLDTDGEKLAGRPEQPIQFIHARDMAEWMLKAAAEGRSGPYNLTGDIYRMDDLHNTIIAATGKRVNLIYVGDEFLQEHEVAPIDGLTFWFPKASEGIAHGDIERALNTGLTLRPLAVSVDETLRWLRRDGFRLDFLGRMIQPGVMSAEREAELLAIWRERQARAT